MNLQNAFSKADYDKVIEFLNFIAKRAKFDKWTTQDSIDHFKLLAHMQQVVLPKIQNHIFEIEKITKANKANNEEG